MMELELLEDRDGNVFYGFTAAPRRKAKRATGPRWATVEKRATALGATIHGGDVMAPDGYIFAGPEIHCIGHGDFRGMMDDMAEGVTRCLVEDCDSCQG